MRPFVIVEIGSTTTKSYLCKKGTVERLDLKTIEFKNNYKKTGKITTEDKKKLFDLINSIEEDEIYVFGTSIFRDLTDEQKSEWSREFKEETGLDFKIVTAEEENELTVYGAIAHAEYDGTIAVMIGGGGSTEMSIVKNGEIIEKCNYSFGAMDVTDMFPDLKEDKASSEFDHMVAETKKLMDEPLNKADILILAGGDYIYFYEELKYPIDKNNFYDSVLQPYCLDKVKMDELDQNFFYDVSLDEVCKRTGEIGWWLGARGMRLCVKALADNLEAKYIIPTRITMVYGIAEKILNGETI